MTEPATDDDLPGRLEAHLDETVRRGREIAEHLLDSEEEMTPPEWCLAVLEKLRRLSADDLATVDGLCAALLDPGDGRAREAALEVVGRLFEGAPR